MKHMQEKAAQFVLETGSNPKVGAENDYQLIIERIEKILKAKEKILEGEKVQNIKKEVSVQIIDSFISNKFNFDFSFLANGNIRINFEVEKTRQFYLYIIEEKPFFRMKLYSDWDNKLLLEEIVKNPHDVSLFLIEIHNFIY